jgi:hypothetical protein
MTNDIKPLGNQFCVRHQRTDLHLSITRKTSNPMAEDTREASAAGAVSADAGVAAGTEPQKVFPKGVVLGKDGKPSVPRVPRPPNDSKFVR